MKIYSILVLILPLVLSDDLFIKANNKFSPQAYEEIAKTTKDNFLLSPFSAETVLAFAQAGAKGETAEELRNSLQLPNDQAKIESAVKTSLPDIKASDSYSLYTANKIYIKQDFSIRQSFQDVATDVFGAAVEKLNFLEKTKAAKTINDWVQEQTNNKIVNLIDPESFNTRTRSVLVNSLYFKADWLAPFKLVFTNKDNFYKSSENVILTETMHNRPGQRFNYFECHHINAKFLELPFKGKDAFLTIVLPNEKEGLANLEINLERVFAPHNFSKEQVVVSLPKFKIGSKIDLKPILKNLGVKKAFDPELADLSGIAGEPGDLIIDEVVQKTFIDVSEEGVEAAAATFVLIPVPSSFIVNIKTFNADHPFIFYVKAKGAIIFAGRVINPSQ